MKLTQKIARGMTLAKVNIKKASPTIFAVTASVGVVVTFALTIKGAHNANKRVEEKIAELIDAEIEPTKIDIFKAAAPSYIPAAATAMATIACIFMSNHLNKKQQMAIAAAYEVARGTFANYTEKVKEKYGEEAHRQILTELNAETADLTPCSFSNALHRDSRYVGDPNDKIMFYDSYSDRYFESTIGHVIDAQFHLNRNYILRGYVLLNEYYDFLGISNTVDGDKVGWDIGNEHDGIWFIDFNMKKCKRTMSNGERLDVVEVYAPFPPCYLSGEYFMK